MAPGSLDPGGRGIRKIQKVRLLHAAIRHLVANSGRWDVAVDGELVGLPHTRWDRAMGWQAGVGRVLDRAQSARGPIGSLTKMVGAGILNQWCAPWTG